MVMKTDPREHLAPVWARYTDFVAERGEGAYIVSTEGRRYLDFTCGIGVTNTGHCHPTVVAAAQEQLGRLIHGQINIMYHQPVLRLVEALLPEMPSGLDTFFFANSGAEAIEGAMKLARAATGREGVIVFQGSFHGRTTGAVALTTSKARYRLHAGQLPGGIQVTTFPYCLHCPRRGAHEGCCQQGLADLRELLATRMAPESVAAILIEPVLGEGGYVVPPSWFLPALRKLCDEHGILLIADEVQSGFGRTGRMFAVEHTKTTPDIMVMAKGLGSGLPISAIAAPRAIMATWTPGSHGGTYGANAVACAAAAATVQVIREENLVENAAAMGKLLLDGMRGMQANHPGLVEVRGLGLMIAAEFAHADGSPDGKRAKQIMHFCTDAGLLILTCGPYDNVLRLIPPLIINQQHVHDGLDILRAAIDASS
jgi:4-aminobutyrate aminotransferase